MSLEFFYGVIYRGNGTYGNIRDSRVPNSIFIIPIWIGGAFSAICSIVIFILNFRKSLEEI